MKATPDQTRRRFIWNAGAALSAPLAVATAHAAQIPADDAAVLRAHLARLEDTAAIRAVHDTWVSAFNTGRSDDVVAALFVDGADVPARAGGISRVSAEMADQEEAIAVAPDRTTATARMPCTVRKDVPIEPSCTVVEMALQQGGGVVRHTERGILEASYVKRDGTWRVDRMLYRPMV